MNMSSRANDVQNIQQSRRYQREMLEESLKQNIVVAVQSLIQHLEQLLTSLDGYWKRQDPYVGWPH